MEKRYHIFKDDDYGIDLPVKIDAVPGNVIKGGN